MISEGMRLTQFYSAAPVCSPSRASLMTGRLYPRTGVYSGKPGTFNSTGLSVFSPFSNGGMNLSEITVAQMLKPLGYATGALGKWHLGIKTQYLPASRGFDSYFGVPMTQNECTSNVESNNKFGPCPTMHNNTVAVQPTDVLNIDAAYVDNIKEFMTVHREGPFFFYYASHHTHMPQFAAPGIRNTTMRGLFGDSLAELDWSVGQILDHIVELGIQNNTLVMFSADNGPELSDVDLGGEQGQLKCGKGTTYEGGVREPGIFWWPSVIEPGSISYALGSTLDLSVTAVSLAGGKPPQDRATDGFDLTPVLTGQSENGPRDHMLYYSGHILMAIRLHQYKAHFYTKGSHCRSTYHDQDCWDATGLQQHDPPLLFDVETDTKERFPLDVTQKEYSAVLAGIVQLKAEHGKGMTFAPGEMNMGGDEMNFPCCNPACTPRNACCACPKREASQHKATNAV
ncbi:arylsulfatase A-like isoform X2 [Sycon ciliatum]